MTYQIEKLQTNTFKLSGPGLNSVIVDSFDEANRIKIICELLQKYYEEKAYMETREILERQ